MVQIPKFKTERGYNSLNSDSEIREALLKKKTEIETTINPTLLGKRAMPEGMDISDLMGFENQTKDDEEIEYGDPSGIEPFMMLELNELTDITTNQQKKEKKEEIGIYELLNTEVEMVTNNQNLGENIEEDSYFTEERLIELDSRFTGSGFKGIMLGVEKEEVEEAKALGKELDFYDLMNVKVNKPKKEKKVIYELEFDELISASAQDPTSHKKKLKVE